MYPLFCLTEDCCYVSQNFDTEVELAKQRRSTVARDYVLPGKLMWGAD